MVPQEQLPYNKTYNGNNSHIHSTYNIFPQRQTTHTKAKTIIHQQAS